MNDLEGQYCNRNCIGVFTVKKIFAKPESDIFLAHLACSYLYHLAN